MFALILHRQAIPIAIGSTCPWAMLAGMIRRPAAISARTASGASPSRPATYSISPVMTPARA